MRAARRREVWLVLFPGSEMLDLGGPWEVLSHANDVLGFEGYALRVHTPFGGNVRTRHGLVFAGTRSLRSAARHPMPDLAIIAGGSPLAPLPLAEAKCARWLRQHQRRIPTLVSICTGAFVLGEAGLLDGRRVTTHWRWMDALRARFPRAHVVDEGIFERDGRLWTSAGISAGIDLTLAIVEEDHGRAAAMAVAKNLVLFLRRSGSQAQFSEALQRQEREPSRLQDITSFVLEHLEEGLPVERLARHLGMSPRSLSRWCRVGLRESPAALVRRLRLEQAQRLLEHTDWPLKLVAAKAGLGDAATLWRAFKQHLGVTPAEYRARFT